MQEDQCVLLNPMIITLDHFNLMRNNFQNRYYLAGCDPNFGGQEIQISWDSFSQTIGNFVKANELDPATVAIRFVHCYDVTRNALYLRMQILTMTATIKQVRRLFSLVDTPCAWYELSNNTITTTQDTSLSNEPYMDNFYYCTALSECTAESLQNLAKDTDGSDFAHTVTYPWLELSKLYTDNNSPENAILCIDASSRLALVEPEVKFQHGLVMYLRMSDGTAMLNNEKGDTAFYYKAADFGTLCPSHCNVYIYPGPL